MQKNNLIDEPSKNSHPVLLWSLICLISIFLFAQFLNISNFVLLGVLMIWLYFLVSNYHCLNKNERGFVFISIFYLLYVIFFYIIGISNDGVRFMLRVVSWIMTGVLSVYVIRFFPKRELSTLFIGYTILLSLYAFYLLTIGSSIRVMGDEAEVALVANAWIGSMYMFIIGMGLIFFLHVKSLILRLIALLVLGLSLYLEISILQRGTIVIMVFFEIALILVFNIKSRIIVRSLVVILGIIGIYVFVSDASVDIFTWLADNVPSQRLADRFQSIVFAFQYDDIYAGGGSFSARYRLIWLSWDTFVSGFDHFIFGVGSHRGDYTLIGNHSFLVDTLASYGIIGGILMFVYYKKQYQLIMSNINRKYDPILYAQCVVVFVFYVLRSFYGDVSFANVNMALLIYFPLIIIYIQNNKVKTIKS